MKLDACSCHHPLAPLNQKENKEIFQLLRHLKCVLYDAESYIWYYKLFDKVLNMSHRTNSHKWFNKTVLVDSPYFLIFFLSLSGLDTAVHNLGYRTYLGKPTHWVLVTDQYPVVSDTPSGGNWSMCGVVVVSAIKAPSIFNEKLGSLFPIS
jgi:hypothetical protein